MSSATEGRSGRRPAAAGPRALLLTAAAALASACSGGVREDADAAGADAGVADASPPASCPIGDLSAAAELAIFHRAADGTWVATTPGAEVPLTEPPQGSSVMTFEVRARNLDGCRLRLTTSLHDVCDGQVLTVEARPTLLADDGAGWGVPISPSYDATVATCPQLTATRDLYDQPYQLQVVVEDADGRRAEAAVEVVPKCASDFCRCQCDQRYEELGAQCPIEGASPPPSC